MFEDFQIRKVIKNKYYSAGISKIEIERSVKKLKINIYTARPGVIIGKGGAGIEIVKSEIQKIDSAGSSIVINIVEIKSYDTDAQLVAENIALQLERRVSFRRAMKQAMQRTMKMRVLGIKLLFQEDWVEQILLELSIIMMEQYHYKL